MTVYIPEGFQVVQLDADGNEIDPEVLENSWTDVLGRTEDEVLIVKDVIRWITFLTKEGQYYFQSVIDRVTAPLQIADIPEPSQHDWVSSETLQKNPTPMARDYVSNPWLSHNRDSGMYRYEFREPIAEPADRAGQAFLGNLAERLENLGKVDACPDCYLVRACNGTCGC